MLLRKVPPIDHAAAVVTICRAIRAPRCYNSVLTSLLPHHTSNRRCFGLLDSDVRRRLVHTATTSPSTTTPMRYMRMAPGTTPRTYELALARLDSLQSNRAVTDLFAVSHSEHSSPASSPSPPAISVNGDGQANGNGANGRKRSPTVKDLNSQAMPEMLAWLGRAGVSTPDLAKLNCIHVAGTKGKGSVCEYLTSILTQPSIRPIAGRVGTYTSPHLVSVRERIQIDGQPISQERFTKYFFEIWDAFTGFARLEYARLHQDKTGVVDFNPEVEAELEGPATKPFYFRFLTVMAFHVFLREGVKSAIIECGIGGEYDSTNVIPAEALTASVVTQLGIDHVAMLGPTLPEIGWHKIGVAKKGRKCFTRRLAGTVGEQTMEVLRRRAQERGAELVEITDRDVKVWGGVTHEGLGSLEGQFQRYNQALAVAAAKEHLRILGANNGVNGVGPLEHLPQDFMVGLQQANLRGRCETREEGNITWLIDGAHTAESLSEVAKWYAAKRESSCPDSRQVLIFNQQDRDAAKLLAVLLETIPDVAASPDTGDFREAFFCRNDLHRRKRGEEPRDLSSQRAAASAFESMVPRGHAVVFNNTEDAVDAVRDVAKANKKVAVLVTGSLHLVGSLLRTLEPETPL